MCFTGSTALIYLLSLSTGEKHPLAANNAVLEYTFAYLAYAVLSVEISGEYVGVSFTLVANIEDQNERARLVVWSWSTGVRKLVSMLGTYTTLSSLADLLSRFYQPFSDSLRFSATILSWDLH